MEVDQALRISKFELDMINAISTVYLRECNKVIDEDFAPSECMISALQNLLASFMYDHCNGCKKTYYNQVKSTSDRLKNIYKIFKEDFPADDDT